jgi:hypothetical protein
MKIEVIVLTALLAAAVIPASAGQKKKADRGMLEKMEAVPCGAKERGLTGLGSIFASAGIQAVNSEEKLCPQYLLRTDDMEYHIRPKDAKHEVLLPVGKEGEFKIKKNLMFLKVVEGDKKTRPYKVVAINQLHAADNVEQGTAYRPADRAERYRKPDQPVEKPTGAMSSPPNPPQQ